MSRGSVTIEDASDDEFDSVSSSSLARAAAGGSSSGGATPGSAHHNAHSNAGAAAADNGAGGLHPGEESAFEVWLHKSVNQPLLSVLPEWVAPNAISVANTLLCWSTFAMGYAAYKYEHAFPSLSMWLRLVMSAAVFVSIILDCLDGMQARKTGRTSKLGEVLDHSFDSANVPLLACAVILTVWPDQYTILISIIGGALIYNAQLVIYRHHHVFVLPPLTGPAAQAMASAALFAFAFFFRVFSRHSYGVQLFVMVFAILGNIAQFQNTAFYTKHLLKSQGTIWPHIRFSCVMVLHGALLLMGYLSHVEYLLSAVCLAYRANGKYVLDTLQGFRPFSATFTKEQVRRDDAGWRWECIAWIVALLVVGALYGTGAKAVEGALPHEVTSITGLPLLTDSLFHVLLYGFMAMCVGLNLWDLKRAMPALTAK